MRIIYLLYFTLLILIHFNSYSQTKLGASFDSKEFEKYDSIIVNGKKAIDIPLINMNKDSVFLSDYKGKYIIIDFWATWCVQCVKEMPRFHEIKDSLKDRKDLVFISISVDEDYDKWFNYLKSKSYSQNEQFLFSNGTKPPVAFYTTSNLKPLINGIEMPVFINGVPAYVAIDKEFNVVNEDLEKPSSKEFLEVINSLR